MSSWSRLGLLLENISVNREERYCQSSLGLTTIDCCTQHSMLDSMLETRPLPGALIHISASEQNWRKQNLTPPEKYL